MEVKIAVRDKNEKGVITVFLALVFGLLLTFLINLVNVTMVNSAKNQMIIASDGLILFINPQGIIEPTLISQLPLSLREDEKNDTSPKERNQK